MASALPATAPSRSARRGERKTIGVEEIEAGVEGLRFPNELLLLRGKVVAAQAMQPADLADQAKGISVYVECQ
jgi:hypothetical protein